MDLRQLAKTVEWLDEQRRKDRQAIVALEEQLRASHELNREYSERLQKIETRVAEMRASTEQRASNLSERLDQAQFESKRQIEIIENRRLKVEKEQERLREIERDANSRALVELRKDKDVVPRVLDELKARREEERRLSLMLTELQQQIPPLYQRVEDSERRISVTLEASRVDAKKLNELQGEIPDLRRRIDETKGRFDVVDEIVRRSEARIGEIVALEADRKLVQTTWIEQQTIFTVERDRVVKKLEEQTSYFQASFQEAVARLDVYTDTYREMRRALGSFQDIVNEIQRRLKESNEVQRINEERVRHDWENFVTEDQKRWTTHMLLRDEQWRDNDRRLQKIGERLQAFDVLIQAVQVELERWQTLDISRMQAIFGLARELMAEYDQTLTRVR
jgi:hypothetical protein